MRLLVTGVVCASLMLAGGPADAQLFQRHVDGQIWKYDGVAQCSANACPGWTLIDKNPRTQDISAGFGGLFQRHVDGAIWKYDGNGQCTTNACPGWTLVDKNPRTQAIAGGLGGFFQRHVDGAIWKYDNAGRCSANACPGWILIDKNPRTKDIVMAHGALFQRHEDGLIWKYDGGGQCTANACPGWTLIDKNPRTQSITGAFGGFYQRHVDGAIWKYDGVGQCTANACPGWKLVDKNPRTQSIAAGFRDLYQRHVDGQVWKYDGQGQCSANACPGWMLIDKNPRTADIAAGRETFFQRHVDGKIWKYDGHSQCSADACPGWTLIDSNPRTAAILAVEPRAPSTARTVTVKVLAYNIYMRPTSLFKNGQMIRARLLPAELRGFDILVFSEAFDDDVRNTLLNGLRGEYRFSTKILGRDRGVEQDGGVIIVSRWPIEAEDQQRYGDVCGGSDCQADKGVLYAKIRVNNLPVHVFGSHTQADPEAADQQIRLRQFEIISRFVASKQIPATEPVIIAGDLNVDRNRFPNETQRMLQTLNATLPSLRGHPFSFDPATNKLASSGRSEYLDYVLFGNSNLVPQSSFNEVLMLRTDKPWKEFFWEKDMRDLSDHYPVLGQFEFPVR